MLICKRQKSQWLLAVYLQKRLLCLIRLPLVDDIGRFVYYHPRVVQRFLPFVVLSIKANKKGKIKSYSYEIVSIKRYDLRSCSRNQCCQYPCHPAFGESGKRTCQ